MESIIPNIITIVIVGLVGLTLLAGLYEWIKGILFKAPLNRQASSPAKTEGKEDAEFAKKDHVLRIFMTAQEPLLRQDGNLNLNSERARLLYLHFVGGAADRLSRTIKDQNRSDLWWHLATLCYATGVFGHDIAVRRLERYGSSSDPVLQAAITRGAEAMNVFLLASINKASEADFKAACMELYAVVSNEAA